jgi:geranylgeranyl diphosphate synthase, type II
MRITTATASYTELLLLYEQHHENIAYNIEPSELYNAVKHIMNIKGKRIRPLLLLMCCDLFEGNTDEAILPALAYEMFHNFTLVHDDIMDEATIRRGVPTVHKSFGNNTAILAGDVMLLHAYRYFEKLNCEKMQPSLHLFTKTAIEIMEGQQVDMNFEKQAVVTEVDYLKMIANKTSVLLGAAAQTGAIIGNADYNTQKNIYAFGLNLGLAFQIKDDYLDAFGDAEKVGKKIGGDILQDKKTYLQVVAQQLANAPQKAMLAEIKTLRDEEKIAATINLFSLLKVKESAEIKMTEFYNAALAHLDAVGADPERKRPLKDFAETVFYRSH